jgi:phosphoribosylanthranilate isomerase
MKVKVCGITNVEDALLSCRLGTDALGFIFYEKSPRFIEAIRAKEIIKRLPALVFKVGVFVNEDVNRVNEISKLAGLNLVQLHGDEPPSYIDKLNLPAIKSFRICEDFNFERLKYYLNCSFLFDSYSTSQIGGTGMSFYWDLIPSELRKEIILAGGVSSENIGQIFSRIEPQAVDLSSSLELYPGKKDPEKLKQFFNIIDQLNLKGK